MQFGRIAIWDSWLGCRTRSGGFWEFCSSNPEGSIFSLFLNFFPQFLFLGLGLVLGLGIGLGLGLGQAQVQVSNHLHRSFVSSFSVLRGCPWYDLDTTVPIGLEWRDVEIRVCCLVSFLGRGGRKRERNPLKSPINDKGQTDRAKICLFSFMLTY